METEKKITFCLGICSYEGIEARNSNGVVLWHYAELGRQRWEFGASKVAEEP